ncbi:MAG: PorP/SprF family type IX secretion system membrane protein [Bacteroidales bacterium]|jgi:type IX secretion system PorP/SprF family membrane protein|nr:PorP/SprF family type IX secretion system membrane protein [Bacteroidales bacterium]
MEKENLTQKRIRIRKTTVYLLAAGMFFHAGNIAGQQSPLYSQYMLNGFVINPALAGADGRIRMSVSVHDYLIGMKNGPKTISASVSGRFLQSKSKVKKRRYVHGNSGKVGMGGLIFNDCNGLVRRVGLQYSYAYHVDINTAHTSQLSFGLSAALSQINIDSKSMNFNDFEPLLAEGFGNLSYVPDAVLGILYRYKAYYVGLTASNLFQRSINYGEFDYNYVLYRHYFLLAGTSFEFNNKFSFSPSLLAKMTSNGVYQAEIAAQTSYKEDIWLALAYRTPSVASMMIGFRAGNVFIGYAYEYNFNAVRTFSKGSQEIVILYRIGDPVRRYSWGTRF